MSGDRETAARAGDRLADQICDELVQRAAGLAALLGADLAADLPARAEQAAPRIAAQLRAGDDHEAAQTVIDLAAAGVIPDDPPESWWATPLGRVTARSVGHPSAEAVTYSYAAAMLGVTRGTVAQLAHRGTLDRHPDGGITTASVRARLTRPGPSQGPGVPPDQEDKENQSRPAPTQLPARARRSVLT